MSVTNAATVRFAGCRCVGPPLMGLGIAALALLGCKEEVKRRKTRGSPGASKKGAKNLRKVGKPSAELVGDHGKKSGKKRRKTRETGNRIHKRRVAATAKFIAYAGLH